MEWKLDPIAERTPPYGVDGAVYLLARQIVEDDRPLRVESSLVAAGDRREAGAPFLRRRVRKLASGAASVLIAASLPAIAPAGGDETSAVTEAAVRAHANGIWSLAPAGSLRRWVVIHGARDAGVLHLEVLGAAPGAPAWQVRHLVDHMAVTLPALLSSVERPLERGAVYPERFDEALRRWQTESAAGRGEVCATTIDRCLAGEWR